jgi:threonylcarbamoyladenosine tRNA methylthiotransferase MtaB
MPQLERSLIKTRAARLRQKGDDAYRTHLETLTGTHQRVLIEKLGIGRTETFTLVKTDGGEAGSIIDVDIKGHNGSMAIGNIATTKAA